MPIVVDPGFSWPPEVDPVVSPDGRLTAIVDPAHAGVLLRADFDDSVPDTPAVPEKVLRRNLALNPLGPSMTSTDGIRSSDVSGLSVVQDGGRPVLQQLENGSSTSLYLDQNSNFSPPAGTKIHVSVEVKVTENINANMRVRLPSYGSAVINDSISAPDAPQTISQGWVKYEVNAVVVAMPEGAYTRALIYPGTGSGTNQSFSTGKGFLVRNFLIELNSVGTWFDGKSAVSGHMRYRYASDGSSEEYTPATPFIPGKPGTVAKVRFERQDGSVVRSGNPAWAPGGYAHAYDHEATLGGGTLWRAVPIHFDGSEGEPSEYVGAVIPALTDGWAWLKPVTDPDKAMLLKVEPPDLTYDGRVDTTSIAGAPRPAATWDVLEGFTTQLRSLVRERDVEQQLMALLDEGPVLAQFPACAGLPDFYFIRGKLDLEHVHWDGWPWRRYQWEVVQIDRPDTTDSPLRIPGLSYDTVERDWTTYDQLAATVDSYNKLLEP